MFLRGWGGVIVRPIKIAYSIFKTLKIPPNRITSLWDVSFTFVCHIWKSTFLSRKTTLWGVNYGTPRVTGRCHIKNLVSNDTGWVRYLTKSKLASLLAALSTCRWKGFLVSVLSFHISDLLSDWIINEAPNCLRWAAQRRRLLSGFILSLTSARRTMPGHSEINEWKRAPWLLRETCYDVTWLWAQGLSTQGVMESGHHFIVSYEAQTGITAVLGDFRNSLRTIHSCLKPLFWKKKKIEQTWGARKGIQVVVL